MSAASYLPDTQVLCRVDNDTSEHTTETARNEIDKAVGVVFHRLFMQHTAGLGT